MKTALVVGISLMRKKYIKKKPCMQQDRFPIVLESTGGLNVAQGMVLNPSLLMRHFSDPCFGN